MKTKKLVSLLLIFVVCLNATTFVSAKKPIKESVPVEEISIRVVDYETYLKDIAEFEEKTKDIINEDKLTDDITILSPQEIAKRSADYKSSKKSDDVYTLSDYGGIGGYLSGDYYHELMYYDPDTAYICYYYKNLGYVRLVNNTSSTGTLSYVQSSTVSVSADLSTSCTISASAKATMLGFAEVEAGVSCTLGVTVSAGTSFASQAGGTISVPPYATRRITAYYDGVYVGGTAYYYIYDESNGYPGLLIEVNDARPASDQVVQSNGISLVISDY